MYKISNKCVGNGMTARTRTRARWLSSGVSPSEMTPKANLFPSPCTEFSLFTSPVLVDADAAIFADMDRIAHPNGRVDDVDGKISGLVQVGGAGPSKAGVALIIVVVVVDVNVVQCSFEAHARVVDDFNVRCFFRRFFGRRCRDAKQR